MLTCRHSLPTWLHVAKLGAHTLKLKMVALELDSVVVVVLGPVWAAVLLIVLSPTLPIPCANKGMLRVSARGEAARVGARERGRRQRSEARRQGAEGGAEGGGRRQSKQGR